MSEGAEATAGEATSGRSQFIVSLLLAIGCWVAAAALQAALYLRPAPYGGPFLIEWTRYFPFALYYELLGIWLVALPFLLLWILLYRRPLRSPAWRYVALLQLVLLTFYLALSQVDHEILRYLGLRLNVSFLHAYGQPAMLGDRLFIDLLRTDQGGPFLPLVLLLIVPGGYLWWGSRRLRRSPRRAGLPIWLALILALAVPAVPAQSWAKANGQFRLRKVEPVPIALAVDLHAGSADRVAPADFDRLVADYQESWLARSTDRGWRFVEEERPYLRVPTGPAAAPERRWNVIYLQLETFRGADMGFLRPDRRPSPTPYLDRLAASSDAAVWTRAVSLGMPSINGLFATHCSIAPPSRRYITTLTHVDLLCLPELLRRRGYRTEMFNGGDTDWDNSSPWLHQWYDRLWRFPEAEQRDRDIFRAASREVRRLGRSGQPFFAAIVSVSNHTPFRSREPALDIAGHGSLAETILNTTHYTDDVVREFLEGLRGETWFRDTLVVVVGDHGFNVGEHDAMPGRHDLYRESVWVPLIVAGPHPRLPAGRHDGPATLLDVAPTLADLLGIRIANPWQGHSLLAVNGSGFLGFGFRDLLLAETPSWTAVRDPRDGRPRLFDSRTDWLQRRDLADRHPAAARRLLERADGRRRLHDFLLFQGRVWRRTAS